jgi:glycosyltransferase involved in cell wall biosynthesis
MATFDSQPSPSRNAPLRIGFIGTVTPAKGPDVLARAQALLPRGTSTLSLWGSVTASPSYAARVRSALVPGEASFAGPFPAGHSAEALAEIDVLVVPSIWYENAPLVISEAFRNGVPVVASRLGGMAEMVADGVDGCLFNPGSAEDLARVLRVLVEDRAALTRLRAGITSPRTVDDDAAVLESLYKELVGESQ